MQNIWTDEQLKRAFYLYCVLPFGKLHSKTPEIVELANRIGRTPSALAMKLVNFASLDPVITSSGRKGLSGASANDRKIWAQFHTDWNGLIENCVTMDELAQEINPETKANLKSIAEIVTNPPLNAGTMRLAETKVRIGQQFFRQSVLANYKSRCCISGLDIPALLVASHIVPWALDDSNRLNPSNGLCLSSIHDKAFDQGLISLDETNRVIVSSTINNHTNPFVIDALFGFSGKKIQLPEKFAPSQQFIQRHRETIFKQ
jgi:HNH endonuclease